MSDTPFKRGKVTKELVMGARKKAEKNETPDEVYAAHKEQRIHMLRTQLNKDRQALRDGYTIVKGNKVNMDTKTRALFNSRINRAINMLDKEYGNQASFDDGFNEALDRYKK